WLQRRSELDRLVPGQIAFDPHEGSVVVEDQGVAGEPQGVEVPGAVGLGEEEVVRRCGEPVAEVPAGVTRVDRSRGPPAFTRAVRGGAGGGPGGWSCAVGPRGRWRRGKAGTRPGRARRARGRRPRWPADGSNEVIAESGTPTLALLTRRTPCARPAGERGGAWR